jgi:DNA repair protein RecO (recombination protein O)
MPRTAASFTYSAQALVLRARPLGEKDRVLTLFSPEKGRFSAVAKGARGPKSKLAALAQPFVIARFLLAKGRSLDIVSQAQIETAHPTLTSNVFKTAWASFVCEVADTLPEGMADETGFEITSVALGALDAADDDRAVEAAGVWFETQWLAHQGYAPVIGHCVMCERKISLNSEDNGARVRFSPESGGTLCDGCRADEGRTEAVAAQTLRALYRLERSRRVPASLYDAPFELDGRNEAELGRCVRRALLFHLGARLRSAPFLEELRASHRLNLPAR